MPLDPKCSPKAGKASHLRSGEAAKPQMAEKVYCFRFGVRGLGLGSTGLGFREAPNTPKRLNPKDMVAPKVVCRA